MTEQLGIEMGKRINERRKQLRLSQEEMAERVNSSKQTISLWENGHTEILAGNIVKIAEALDISTDYLLTGKRNDADYKLLDEHIRKLSNEQHGFLYDTIQRFSSYKKSLRF